MDNATVLMVLGATGCGKTTLVNAMFNYHWNVKFTDEYRYKIVNDETSQSQMSSQTADITAYHLRSRVDGKNYIIIDTPGFGDTDMRDDDFTKNLYSFFKRT